MTAGAGALARRRERVDDAAGWRLGAGTVGGLAGESEGERRFGREREEGAAEAARTRARKEGPSPALLEE